MTSAEHPTITEDQDAAQSSGRVPPETLRQARAVLIESAMLVAVNGHRLHPQLQVWQDQIRLSAGLLAENKDDDIFAIRTTACRMIDLLDAGHPMSYALRASYIRLSLTALYEDRTARLLQTVRVAAAAEAEAVLE